ncbi:CocE/NonD family hydrolase [Micromonospora haikouensis]|uniref:CocE/NonD family hydrolase n=1 Tax=Micromonospora haikouensis TaxID=686309 RepID=UPI003792F7F5
MSTRPKNDFVTKLAGRLGQRMLKLPPAVTREVTVERDIPITVEDGVTLLADHWAPAGSAGIPLEQLPTVVVRTAYGPGGPLGWMYGRAIAERGMHVLMVRSRGTFGSGGTFLAMRHEREDGLATLRWLADQPWARGGVVLAGSSYFGYTQWAVAAEAPVQVKAMVPHITSSRLALTLLRPGRFELDTLTNWVWNTETQERPRALLRSMLGLDRKRVAAAMNTLPLTGVDKTLLGRESPFFQETVRYDQNDPYWKDEDHSGAVGDVTVPVSSITGWYDIFLTDQLRDFQALAAAGRSPRLTVGPWWHADPVGMGAAIEQVVDWGAALARGEQPADRAPVRLFVMGVGQWRDFDQWPPAGYPRQRWHLRSGGALERGVNPASPPSTFTYDPNDPTPSVGGPKLDGNGPGPKDNRSLEKRADVLTFTSPVLESDLEVVGQVTAQVWLRADRPSNDLFVRLCDVDERGKSINVCDDLVTVRPDGTTEVTVELSPTAYVFRRGHRLRVQVSAGAFPRFARNLGGDEPVATATTAHVTHLEILHDGVHPSAILLPAKA